MQNNDYREWLLYSCGLMEQTIYWLFCSAMELSFTGELKDVLLPGETIELPGDILLAMEDPLVRRMGQTVTESIALLNSLKNINDLGDTATHSLLEDNADATEADALAAPELAYNDQLNVITAYIKNAVLQMQHAVWELSAFNETCTAIEITAVGESNAYLDGDDMNIGLLSAFVKKLNALQQVVGKGF